MAALLVLGQWLLGIYLITPLWLESQPELLGVAIRKSDMGFRSWPILVKLFYRYFSDKYFSFFLPYLRPYINVAFAACLREET